MGKYVNSVLTTNETVIYEAKNHWIIFISLKSLISLGIIPLIEYFTDEYVITNKRIMIRIGFISRRTLEMSLEKVESIGVDQGILGRILNFGSLKITGTGATKEVFYKVGKPMELKKAADSQIHK